MFVKYCQKKSDYKLKNNNNDEGNKFVINYK